MTQLVKMGDPTVSKYPSVSIRLGPVLSNSENNSKILQSDYLIKIIVAYEMSFPYKLPRMGCPSKHVNDM